MFRMNKRRRFLGDKYADCARVKNGKHWIRKLSAVEIEEFRAGIQRIINGAIPRARKSIV